MHREHFYVNPRDVRGSELILSEEETHHLLRVLRKKKGDIVWVVDGEGTGYEVKILHIETNGARGKILTTRRRIGEPVAEIHLAQGVLKGERFDWLVEKATEIGIRKIIPFTSENAVTVAGPQKVARWKRIAMAAMKQSGRSVLPEIASTMTFHQVVSLGSNCSCRLIAHIGPESVSVKSIESKHHISTQRALLVVGPEGGFSKEEMTRAVEHGFRPVTLGPRRLRAETAGIVFSTLVLSKLGELE
ncbi:16S rRNA (uracil(1498)-N(3))-methyltransferase [bacterium]|nr:16S rRNA (uracil(1498)-N(3))-methyltransferase [bacterium]RQV93820.1 MAG: 16S rRNA (uracil(1498)-N(3))-methyltransferase [bacterium]